MNKLYFNLKVLLNSTANARTFFYLATCLLSATSGFAQNDYCIPTLNQPNAATEPISLVQFGTIDNASSAELDVEIPKYEDFSDLSTDVQRGESYTLTVQGNTDGDNINYITIYIDWNQDGVFSNSLSQNEKYQYTDALTNSNGLDDVYMTYDIIIPTDAVLGTTRMRIVKNYQSPSPAPCTSVAVFGQVEDYSLAVADTNSVYNVEIATANDLPANIEAVGATLELIATVHPNTASQAVIWTVEAGSDYATINTSGLVTALTSGAALIRATSVEDDTKYYEIEVYISIPQTAVVPDFTENFDGATNWTFTNEGQANKWLIGNATSNSGDKSLYISNDYGTSNTYTTSISTRSHAYRDIALPEGTTTATLSFDWQAAGDFYSGGWGDFYYDYLRVWIVPASYTPTAGTAINSENGNLQIGSHFVNQDGFASYYNDELDLSAFAGENMRLVFEWTNDNDGGNQPAAAVDNIEFLLGEVSDPCVAVATFDYSFEDFTTFPEQCWSASHGSPMIMLTGTADKAVQVYSFMAGTSDFYLVTPQVSTIDGLHVLEFEVSTASTGMNIQIGTLLNPTDYASFVPAGTLITPATGNSYTSVAIPAVANHSYVAIKIIPNGNHRAVSISNVEWKMGNLSVGSFEKNLVKVYPNPTTDYATIQSDEKVKEVRLYNQMGQLIKIQDLNVIDFTNVSSGIYFAEILFEDNTTVKQKIVRK